MEDVQKTKGLLTPNGRLQPCELINGNIVLIPRYVYQQVGTNDPYFQHAIGDNDYGYRVIEAGLKKYGSSRNIRRMRSS